MDILKINYCWIVFFVNITNVYLIDIWWSLAFKDDHILSIKSTDFYKSQQINKKYKNQPTNKSFSIRCRSFNALSRKQLKICQKYFDHILVVRRASLMALDECGYQYANDRWNCSSHDINYYNMLSKADTSQSAYLYALMSASTLHYIGRACKEGDLKTCSCKIKQKPFSLPKDWHWQSCGDNFEYGYKFSIGFIDSREKEKRFSKKFKDYSHVLMNLHNNEAGRRAAYAYMKPTCKCHGLSGSCNVKTCWNQIPTIREISTRLKKRYNSSYKVKLNREGTKLEEENYKFNIPSKEDLIFLQSSPDFCEERLKLGSVGTHGRVCYMTSIPYNYTMHMNTNLLYSNINNKNNIKNKYKNSLESINSKVFENINNNIDHSNSMYYKPFEKNHLIHNCNYLCCGKGYQIIEKVVYEKCHCKFFWCCTVKCKMCESLIVKYICN